MGFIPIFCCPINRQLKLACAFKGEARGRYDKMKKFPRKEVNHMPSGNRRLYQLDHCTYNCSYHIVWTPKYRGKVLGDTYIKQELKRMFKYILRMATMILTPLD
jgi:hypothetical protein